jgi:hypothetical protein
MYKRLVTLNDEWTRDYLPQQVIDAASKYDGGIRDPYGGIPRPSHVATPAVMAVWAAAYVCPESRYCGDAGVLAALERAADFMLRRQHPDGTVSLGSTNFNSPPDTAFVVGGLAPMYRLLHERGGEAAQPVAAKLRTFLERTVPAMLTGGVHTPNHRWVISAALAHLYELFQLPELRARAEEWLAEGMDITEDGEWTERSNGIYNAVSDIALYHVARIFDRPELYDCIRRNLEMMLYLVHPSGEVVTEYSGRQDFGQAADLSAYTLIYGLMAAKDDSAVFASMGDAAASCVAHPGGVNNNALVGMLLQPEARLEGMERAPLPDRYVKLLNERHPVDEHLARMKDVGHHGIIYHSRMHTHFGAPVLRVRDGATSVTAMCRAPSFLSIRHGAAKLLGVKLSSSFPPGVVEFDSLRAAVDGSGYVLTKRMEKGYYGPVPRALLPADIGREPASPWYLLPHQHRPLTHNQTHELTAVLFPEADGWTIRLSSDEREDVYTQLTFIFGLDGAISGEGLQPLGGGGDNYLLQTGACEYRAGGDTIVIEGGACEHRLAAMRDDNHPAGCLYVHVNLVTPFAREFRVRLK